MVSLESGAIGVGVSLSVMVGVLHGVLGERCGCPALPSIGGAVVPIDAVRREGGLKCAGLQGDQGLRKCSWCPWKVEVGQRMRVPVSLSSLPLERRWL